jgi:hypothetical protein
VDKTGAGAQTISGARNFSFDEPHELNSDRADDEASGDIVLMSAGPFPVRFELLAHDTNCVTGYVKTMVATGKEITVANGAESSANKTYTFSDGYIKVGADFPTDGAGRLPVAGEFKSLVKA